MIREILWAAVVFFAPLVLPPVAIDVFNAMVWHLIEGFGPLVVILLFFALIQELRHGT